MRQVPEAAFTGLLQSVWLGGDRTILALITNHLSLLTAALGEFSFSERFIEAARQVQAPTQAPHVVSFWIQVPLQKKPRNCPAEHRRIEKKAIHLDDMKVDSSLALPIVTFAPKHIEASPSVGERFVYKVTPADATKPFHLTTPTSGSLGAASQAQMDELQLAAQATEILARFLAGAIADHFGPSGRIINNTIWLGISGIKCCLTIKKSKGLEMKAVTQLVHVGEDALHLVGSFSGFEAAEMLAANVGCITKLGKVATGGVLTPFESATLTPRIPRR